MRRRILQAAGLAVLFAAGFSVNLGHVGLVLCALADAQSYREDLEEEDSVEAYAALAAELEEFA